MDEKQPLPPAEEPLIPAAPQPQTPLRQPQYAPQAQVQPQPTAPQPQYAPPQQYAQPNYAAPPAYPATKKSKLPLVLIIIGAVVLLLILGIGACAIIGHMIDDGGGSRTIVDTQSGTSSSGTSSGSSSSGASSGNSGGGGNSGSSGSGTPTTGLTSGLQPDGTYYSASLEAFITPTPGWTYGESDGVLTLTSPSGECKLLVREDRRDPAALAQSSDAVMQEWREIGDYDDVSLVADEAVDRGSYLWWKLSFVGYWDSYMVRMQLYACENPHGGSYTLMAIETDDSPKDEWGSLDDMVATFKIK